MLSAIVRFAIRFRGVVVAVAVLLAAYGIYSATRSKLDVFPEFAPALVIANVEAPGFSADQVETLVTRPVESELGGTVGLDTMRSRSLPGLSVVTLTFKSGTDVHRARQLVAERLQSLGAALPTGVRPPTLLPLSSSTGTVLIFGLTSRDRSAMDLRAFADWVAKPRLLAVPGAADVIVFGGEVAQYEVRVDPAALARHDLALQDVLRAASRATGVRAAGFVESRNQRIAVAADAQPRSAQQIADTVVAFKDGIGIRLGDVARVVVGPEAKLGDASIMGEPGVMMMVESQYHADPITVTQGVDRALDQLRPALAAEHIVLHRDIFRSAGFIDTALGHLRTALIVGSVLVVIVLFLFLLQVRTALISLVAIPLSLLAAVIALNALGVTINTMTLGGLAIALGEVVDDAIVDVENIYRRLRLNQGLANPEPAWRVVLHASLEVRSAVVFATLIVVVAFLPVVTMSGVSGALFAPLGYAYMAAVIASLGVALTVTPALCLLLLGNRALAPSEPRLIAAFKRRYVTALRAVERRPSIAVVVLVVLAIVSIVLIPFFSASFIPDLKEGHYIVHASGAPGTSLGEMMRIGSRITQVLRTIPGVRIVAQRSGRAEDLVDPAGPEVSEIEVELQPMSGGEQTRTVAAIRQALAGFPGLTTSVNTFLKERLDETISGETAPLTVSVFGENLDTIDEKAREVAAVLAQIPGAIGLAMQAPPGTPQLTVRLRRQRLAQYGLTPGDVLDAMQAAQQGVRVGQVYEGGRTLPVRVILAPLGGGGLLDVGSLPIRNPDGTVIALRDVADIVETQARSQILHTGGERVQAVSVHVRGRSVSDFSSEAQATIAKRVSFPRGTYAVFTGEAQARAAAQRELWFHFAIAAAGIVLLLFLGLKTIRGTLLVLANLPFALLGGVVAVAISGGDLSLGSMVGFVTLFGITLRNSIMLISHYERLVQVEGATWDLETATRGAAERLVPILMTALATALALLPLAILAGEPGNEIEGPMAIVIVGGLFTSTFLNLLVLPAMALRWGRFRAIDPTDTLEAEGSDDPARDSRL